MSALGSGVSVIDDGRIVHRGTHDPARFIRPSELRAMCEAAGLDVLLNIHVNGQPMPLGGTVDVSGGVRYDPNQGAFFLAEPRIDALRIQGIPDRYTAKVSAVIADALGDFYRERPVYTLSRADAKQAAARLVLKDVRVSRKTLIVTLGL